MNLLGSFAQASDANAPRSPEDFAERRRLARRLIEQGSDYSPVQHWVQGLARVAQGALGGYDARMIDQEERAARAGAAEVENSLLSSIHGGDTRPTTEGYAPPPVASSPVSGKGYDNPQAKDEYDFALSKGLQPHQAAAYVGAKLAESRLNPDARNPGDGRDGSDSVGQFQWNGPRAAALKQFAAQQGKSWNDPAVQREFSFQELDGPERFAGSALRAAKTPEDATAAMLHYLRPGGYTRDNPLAAGSAGARIRNTQGILSAFAGQQSSGAPTPQQTVMAQNLVQGRPMQEIMSDAADLGDGRYRAQTLQDDRLGAVAARADRPESGAQQAQFFIPGRQAPTQPTQAPAAPQTAAPNDNARLRTAITVLNNPFSSPGAKVLAQQLLAQEKKDPRDGVIKDLTIEEKRKSLGRVEMETMTAPDGTVFEREKGKPGATWQQTIQLPQKSEDRTGYMKELDDENKARAARGEKQLSIMEYRTQLGKASAPSVNIDQKQENEFGKETGKALAKRFDEMVGEGDAAAQNLEVVANLRSLNNNIGTGAGAVVRSYLGKAGIKTEGISDIEAYNALVDRLTPQQRLPGSGATSDFDARLFKSSLPQLMNTPGGNEYIINSMEKIVQNRMARGDIAIRVQVGELTPKEGLAEIRKLQAEAKGIAESARDFGKAKPGTTAATAPAGPPAPAPDGWQEVSPGIRIREKR